jgi:hypothetical protein
MTIASWILKVFDRIFSEKSVRSIEKYAVYFALFGFLVHLLLIFLWNIDMINHAAFDKFSGDYISAIYTPFSFLLIFEVFLLLVYLPKSFTKSIGKQYEIMLLLVLRRIFKDISYFDMKHLTDNLTNNRELLFDMLSVLFLFFLIGIFYRLKKKQPFVESCGDIQNFILIKKAISIIMVPVMLIMVLFSFGNWFWEMISFHELQAFPMTDINNVFYDTFFTILIFIDVFILIISFLYTHYYSQLVRNSGFVISTVLIRLSFSAPHLTNLFLIELSVIFGVLILLIYNFFVKEEDSRGSENPKIITQTKH